MRVLVLLLAISMAVYGENELATSVLPAADVQILRVTGDRVSLRSTPGLDGYPLESMMRGDELVYVGRTNGWVEVAVPDSIDFWVASEYVTNGVVVPKKLNVRCGPNQNYGKVALVLGGDQLDVRGESNGWLQIAPPAGSTVWISEDYVEFVQPPAPEVAEKKVPDPDVAEETVVAEKIEPAVATAVAARPYVKEEKALMLVMDENRKQGDYVEIPGILRRAGPGLFKLVLIDGEWEEPICLVQGKVEQLERYLNRSMLIKGKRYWAKGVDLPVVQPEGIHLDPIIKD
ncbi:MAG: SH3 domain-containing protein [Pontiellaceae bacterium]|nr:SH3 domain-containing protein [Pontiellaceae bacterium]MBN2783963.1 SH3 domain-containing protein [Pontiellaceae bacterium]